jgi:hypothetical protein
MTYRKGHAPDRVEQYAREERQKPGGGPSAELGAEARSAALLALYEPPEHVVEIARQRVADRARDAEEEARFLDMLGIGGAA